MRLKSRMDDDIRKIFRDFMLIFFYSFFDPNK